MISMMVKFCTHCDKVIENCKYQQALRGFQLDNFADIWVEEREVPPWISSDSLEKLP